MMIMITLYLASLWARPGAMRRSEARRVKLSWAECIRSYAFYVIRRNRETSVGYVLFCYWLAIIDLNMLNLEASSTRIYYMSMRCEHSQLTFKSLIEGRLSRLPAVAPDPNLLPRGHVPPVGTVLLGSSAGHTEVKGPRNKNVREALPELRCPVNSGGRFQHTPASVTSAS